MMTIKEYIDSKNRNPHAKWFNRLNASAAARVVTALVRMEQGNFSNVKSIGEGVLECRIDFGPGYRIYLTVMVRASLYCLVVVRRKRQQNDIEAAKLLWKEYKRRKSQEG